MTMMPHPPPSAPSDAPSPLIYDSHVEVVDLLPLGGDYFRLRISAEAAFMATAEPGCFVMIESPGQMLRRPFSVLDQLPDTADGRCQFDILFKVVGEGTRRLSVLSPGAKLAALGPLGNGFAAPPSGVQAVCVGGGFGLAPFKFALRRWADRAGEKVADARTHPAPIIFAGARTKADLTFKPLLDEALAAWPSAQLVVTTEDASLGTAGRVTAALVPYLDSALASNRPVQLYACGPTGMLRAIAGIAEERKLVAMLSLEAHMACGYGVCNGCVVQRKTPDGSRAYARICVEGPVFAASDVIV